MAIVHFQYNVYTSARTLKSQCNLTRGIIGKLAVKKILTEMEKNTHQPTKCPIIDFWGLSIMLQESFCLIPFPCNPEMTAWANSLMNSQWIHTRQKRQLEVALTTRSPQHCVDVISIPHKGWYTLMDVCHHFATGSLQARYPFASGLH